MTQLTCVVCLQLEHGGAHRRRESEAVPGCCRGRPAGAARRNQVIPHFMTSLTLASFKSQISCDTLIRPIMNARTVFVLQLFFNVCVISKHQSFDCCYVQLNNLFHAEINYETLFSTSSCAGVCCEIRRRNESRSLFCSFSFCCSFNILLTRVASPASVASGCSVLRTSRQLRRSFSTGDVTRSLTG